MENEQFRDREFFVEVEYENSGMRVQHPGAFARFDPNPIRHPQRAPLLGEHSDELLNETRDAASRTVTPEGTPSKSTLPLSGIKVLDFSWALAGPLATRVLADYGATVVRVESGGRPDALRSMGPFQGGRQGHDRSVTFHNVNIGKQMITLDLRKPEAREVVLDLVRWADVVTESFSAGTMAALGFGYEDLVKVNPQLVMLSSCLLGQTGPQSKFAGYGNLAAAMTGFLGLVGWPDRPPTGPYGAYTDYIAPAFTVAAILAALDRRNRTKQSQRIDLSQAEASLHFLAPTLLDYATNGRVGERCGNLDRTSAPHGVYPADGDDRWVAIAVESDAQWRALSDWLGKPELGSDPRYATASARLDRTSELDALIGEKTRALSMKQVETELQSRGVPAHAVLDTVGMVDEPQLLHRGHFVSIEPPGEEPTVVENSRFKLSRTPAKLDKRRPTLGRDTHAVLKELLGYSEKRIEELSSAGALN
jgi:crotonobetainyl-CoA:carnitine CoA-transferase CaiB-like acyl-CoA transferase